MSAAPASSRAISASVEGEGSQQESKGAKREHRGEHAKEESHEEEQNQGGIREGRCKKKKKNSANTGQRKIETAACTR